MGVINGIRVQAFTARFVATTPAGQEEVRDDVVAAFLEAFLAGDDTIKRPDCDFELGEVKEQRIEVVPRAELRRLRRAARRGEKVSTP
ncbi:hypothetical protein HYZ80_02325 [Candidatus Parcubacteria bacterium]|nr:hypothetical protein [Candidatus Parcubacteria bacterium]